MFEATVVLLRGFGRLQEEPGADDMLDLPEVMRDVVVHRILVPAAMASGKTDLPHKAAALFHCFAMGNPSWSQLDYFLRWRCSSTSDLDVEAGLVNFNCHLCQWICS